MQIIEGFRVFENICIKGHRGFICIFTVPSTRLLSVTNDASHLLCPHCHGGFASYFVHRRESGFRDTVLVAYCHTKVLVVSLNKTVFIIIKK